MSASNARPSLRLFTLALGIALLSSACVIYDEEADVRAHWTFAGLGCREAGVAFVQVRLEERGGGDVWDSRLVPCDDGWVEFAGLPPGPYWITAYGFAPTGDWPTWDLSLRIDLHSGFNEFTLELVPAGSL